MAGSGAGHPLRAEIAGAPVNLNHGNLYACFGSGVEGGVVEVDGGEMMITKNYGCGSIAIARETAVQTR